MSVQRMWSGTWRRFRGLSWSIGEPARQWNQKDGRTPQELLPSDFSAALYIDLNPDLAALVRSSSVAEAHYLDYGRAEGRAYKLDEDRYGQLPADFDAEAYLDINPDLEEFRGKLMAAQGHYLASGRQEGRAYKVPMRSVHRRDPSIISAVPAKNWRDMFKAGDFRAMHPELAGDATTGGALLAAFEARGIDALAPLSLDLSFDPAFYAALVPEIAALPAPELYRAWLEHGIPLGRPGCEREAVHNLLGLTTFPDAFDWRGYAAGIGAQAHDWPRVRLLEHLVVGLTRADDIPLAGRRAIPFLLAVSDVVWSSGRYNLALDVLRRAIDLAPDDSTLHHRMAHRCIEIGRQRDAEHHETRALKLGMSSVWVYTNLAGLASQRGAPEESYRLLALSRARCEGLAPWRQALRDAIEADYAGTAARAWELYRAGERAKGDTEMAVGLMRITDRFRDFEDLPGYVGPTEGGHVVLFANHVLPQCRHYRVEQRSRQFDRLGIPHRVFTSDEVELAREALVGARALIVYREPAFPGTIRLLLHARAMGVPTVYDIDDLIFDPAHYPEGFDTYEKQIAFDSYVGLLYGTPLLRFAISLCDVGLTSTTALARYVAPLTLYGRCHVVPNGLDDRNARFLNAPILRGDTDEIVIFYGSGSQAHNRNFNETVGPALLDLMAAQPRVVLAVAGYLDLDPAFALYANRIRSFPFSRDLQNYWALLSEADINLAVLTPGAMNDGKSEIKWLEAAVSGVPSVVSASARYREVIEDGVDGLLADTPEQWRDALFRFVEDDAFRRSVGRRARERAQRDYSLDRTAERLAAALAPVPISVPRRPRLRVLVVHVLFPPQSSGGATRVVRDNVDSMLDRYGEEVELAVYTTDFDAPVAAPPQDEAEQASKEGGFERGEAPSDVPRTSRMGHYRTIPVFRVSRGSDTEFTYRDEEARDSFAAVLASWKPQLVHFHCVQFLTGSVVEACRAAEIPYVVTLHDAWWISPSQFLIDKDNLLQKPSWRALDDGADTMAEIDRKRFLGDQLAGASALLAVSETFAEVYRRAGFPQTRTVANGLSALFVDSPQRPPVRGGTRVRLGHIGGLSQHKGSHLLRLALEAAPFRNLEAVVVDHAMTPDERVEVVWGTTPTTIRGPAEQDGVRALYGDFDVLVAPSIWPESYGLVSREALAMDLWVVASDLGALGEDLTEGENGFRIDVRDAKDLARVLDLIDAEPDKFRASPARRAVPRLASAQADDLVAIYRDVARPHAAP